MKQRALQILLLSGLAIYCQQEEYNIEEEYNHKDWYHSGITKQKHRSFNNDHLTNFINELSDHVSCSVFNTGNKNKESVKYDSTNRVFDWFENATFRKTDNEWKLYYSHSTHKR